MGISDPSALGRRRSESVRCFRWNDWKWNGKMAGLRVGSRNFEALEGMAARDTIREAREISRETKLTSWFFQMKAQKRNLDFQRAEIRWKDWLTG